jgi:hypothetical protein
MFLYCCYKNKKELGSKAVVLFFGIFKSAETLPELVG